MHIASYLAYEPIQIELSIYGQSITLAIGELKSGNSIGVTLSSTQAEALSETLQAALQTLAPRKDYPDVTIRRLWEPKVEKAPVAEAVEAPPESGSEPAPVFKAA